MHHVTRPRILICLLAIFYSASIPLPAIGLSVTANRVGEDGKPVATGGVLAPAIWGSNERALTYWINLKSFCGSQAASTCPSADDIASSLDTAAKEWESACPQCGITIRRTDIRSNATFEVKYVRIIIGNDKRTREPDYIARAFYPRSKIEYRVLRISPKYFSPFIAIDKVGVFRHEIGHILGYLHEYSVDCKTESDSIPPGLIRMAISDADDASVMAFACGVRENRKSILLSPRDIADHQKIYGASSLIEK
jgi:hypothetical protein